MRWPLNLKYACVTVIRYPRTVIPVIPRIAADSRAIRHAESRTGSVDSRDWYFPLQGRRTTISISTSISGVKSAWTPIVVMLGIASPTSSRKGVTACWNFSLVAFTT